jgi:hypothetical protein
MASSRENWFSGNLHYHHRQLIAKLLINLNKTPAVPGD